MASTAILAQVPLLKRNGRFELLLLAVYVLGCGTGFVISWVLSRGVTISTEFQPCPVELTAVCQWRLRKYGRQRSP